MASRSLISILPALFLLACGSTAASPELCEEALAEVEACFGPEVAVEFGKTCSDEAAQAALDSGCEEPGKADLFINNWLCRNLGLVCDEIETFEDPIEHFKYGTVGAENPGVPLSLLEALPEVCPDLWPETGWEGFGFVTEPDRPLPMGFSTRTIAGVTLTSGNCARCHVSTVRDSVEADPRIFIGGPGQQIDSTGFIEFQLRCMTDDRFTGSRLREILGERDDISTLERNAIALAASSLKSKALESRDPLLAIIAGERTAGPGRSDAFNVGANRLLGWDLVDPPAANSDFGVAWRLQSNPDDLVNFDGNSDDIHESNISVILTLGASEESIDEASLQRMEDMLDAMPAPAYPYAIDPSLAERGQAVFDEHCGECHDPGGARFGTVIDADEVGTDPERAKISTPEFVDAIHEVGAGRPWQFKSFRPSTGYLAGRIDGAWLRAPYLHNGSVPTLRDLLSPPAQRPAGFYRGGDIYDPGAVGFQSDSPTQAGRNLFWFDTALPGNGSGGHAFGTELAPEQTDALIEFLKTL